MRLKNMACKLSTLSLSVLMGLSACTPVLSASASHKYKAYRPHTVRHRHLTKHTKRIIRRDQQEICRIKKEIHADLNKERRNRAIAIYHQLRNADYSNKQCTAILASVYDETGGTFAPVSTAGLLGMPYYAHNKRSFRSYVKRNCLNPNRIMVELYWLHHRQHGYSFGNDHSQSTLKLLTHFNERVLLLPTDVISNRTMRGQLKVASHIIQSAQTKNEPKAKIDSLQQVTHQLKSSVK